MLFDLNRREVVLVAIIDMRISLHENGRNVVINIIFNGKFIGKIMKFVVIEFTFGIKKFIPINV